MRVELSCWTFSDTVIWRYQEFRENIEAWVYKRIYAITKEWEDGRGRVEEVEDVQFSLLSGLLLCYSLIYADRYLSLWNLC